MQPWMDGRRAPNHRDSYHDRHDEQRGSFCPPPSTFPVFDSNPFAGSQVVSDMRTMRINEDTSRPYEASRAWTDFSSSRMPDHINHQRHIPEEEVDYGYPHPRLPPGLYGDLGGYPSVPSSASSTPDFDHSRSVQGTMEDHRDYSAHPQAPSESSYIGSRQSQSRHSLSPSQMQMVRYDPAHARDRVTSPSSSYHDYSNHNGQQFRHAGQHLSSSFQRSLTGNWSTEANAGSGRSLAASQETNSDYTGNSSRGYIEPYRAQSYRSYRDHGDDIYEDDGDNMSDGIASDEGVYDSASSVRAISGDSDGCSEVYSDEGYSSDDYYG